MCINVESCLWLPVACKSKFASSFSSVFDSTNLLNSLLLFTCWLLSAFRCWAVSSQWNNYTSPKKKQLPTMRNITIRAERGNQNRVVVGCKIKAITQKKQWSFIELRGTAESVTASPFTLPIIISSIDIECSFKLFEITRHRQKVLPWNMILLCKRAGLKLSEPRPFISQWKLLLQLSLW